MHSSDHPVVAGGAAQVEGASNRAGLIDTSCSPFQKDWLHPNTNSAELPAQWKIPGMNLRQIGRFSPY
jgi:hypothetical protein|tara:strand:+ start:517 stop:720 length:204 start_codon:yes stop_codon:yes gene_type:complete